MATMRNCQIVSDDLLDEARMRTGLEDFGDFDVINPLKLLCESLNTEAKLNVFDEMVARERLSTVLGTRLRVVEDRKRIPDIANQRIEQPIVLVGLPHTGTTVLFNVLVRTPITACP